MKTARRDLEALAIAGIPVYSQPGRNGGWQLIGGARTDLSGLTEAEAKTLFMVAGPASTATPEAKAALRKLVQALPETFRADAELAANVDRPRPGELGDEVGGPAAIPRRTATGRSSPACRSGSATPIGRAPRRRGSSIRSASSRRDRRGTSSATPTTGCARSASTGSVAVELTDAKAVRPPDFDLAAAWQDIVDTVERQAGARTGRRARRPARLSRPARAVRPDDTCRRRPGR